MIFHRLAGFSLMEVLISLLLLSFILLGFDATEMYSIRMIRSTYYYNVAIHQLNNMSEYLRMLGNNEADLDQEIMRWNTENPQVLPQGRGDIIGHYPDYTMIIYWGNNISTCEQNQLGNSGCIKHHVIL